MKKIISFTLCLVLAFSMFVVFPISTAQAADDYPYKDKVYGRYNNNLDVDPWRYYYRECTSFVAWRLNNRNGVAFHNQYGGVHFSHAKTWGDAAKKSALLLI